MAAVTMSPPQLSSIVIAMPERDAEVADLPRPGQAADLADLEVDDVHRAVGMAAHDHRPGRPSPRRARRAWRCGGGSSGTPRRWGKAARCRRRRRGPRRRPGPPRASSSRCWRRRPGRRRAPASAATARMRAMSAVDLAADLELELAIALGPVARDLGGHRRRASPARSRDRGRSLAVPPAEQRADRQARGLAEDVPAGHVDAPT